MELATVRPPPEGLWRAHRDPLALPQPSPGEAPPNRFDDPQGQYRVRYLATTPRGAFLEVLARFRRSPEADERLQAVTDVDDDLETPPSPATVPASFLASLRLVRAYPAADAEFVDVAAVTVQSRLGQHRLVRQALDTAQLGSAHHPAQLDEATIRLGGPRGRPITQVISRVVFEETTAAGIRYTSRVNANEECWAVFEATPLSFDEPELIARDDPALREAVDQLVLKLPSP